MAVLQTHPPSLSHDSFSSIQSKFHTLRYRPSPTPHPFGSLLSPVHPSFPFMFRDSVRRSVSVAASRLSYSPTIRRWQPPNTTPTPTHNQIIVAMIWTPAYYSNPIATPAASSTTSFLHPSSPFPSNFQFDSLTPPLSSPLSTSANPTSFDDFNHGVSSSNGLPNDPRMLDCILVRHGESEGNIGQEPIYIEPMLQTSLWVMAVATQLL